MKNILLVRNDRFGEFLLNIPAFRAIKRRYPQARLTLLVNPYVAEVASCIDGIDEIIPWEGRRHTLSEIISFSRELRARHFDACVIFNPTKEAHILAFLAAIPMRIGYRRKFGFLLNRAIVDDKHLGVKHEVLCNLDLAALTGANTDEQGLHLKLNAARDFRQETGEHFIVVHPWTSDPVKRWLLQNWRGLIESLLEQYTGNIVIVGTKDDAQISGDVFTGFDRRLINLAGKTSLVELGAVLANAALLISADSGPVHLASSVGTPVVALFRSDLIGKTARRWGPWGEGHAVIEKQTLDDISIAEVASKALEMTRRCAA